MPGTQEVCGLNLSMGILSFSCSSMPKSSVLLYELDKGQYFDLETSYKQSCSPNKKTGR